MSEPQVKHDRLEMAVIGAFLVKDANIEKLRELIKLYGLKSEHFTDSVMHTAFDTIMELKTNDQTTIYKQLMAKITESTVDELYDSAGQTTLDAELHIKDLAEKGQKTKINEIIAKTFRECEGNSSPMATLDLAYKRAKREIDFSKVCADTGVSLADLANPVPEEEDPDCLFKGRFLCKGGGLVLTSVSGSGKSVITMQLCYAWALGRPAFGIMPMRPLKIGIFQTEDDDAENMLFRSSMREGYERFFEWSAEDIKAAESNITFHAPNGRMGRDFVNFIREVQLSKNEKYDLIVINPLQGVTDFDIAKNEQLRKFLREDLDGIIKLNEETKCGVMIVHHTNKPPSPQERGSYGADQYAQYVGAGGAELTNWMRAMLTIMPSSEPGQYKFVAAKRGERLDWAPLKLKDKYTAKPTKIIRHSTKDERILFWHEVNTGNVPSASEQREDNKRANVVTLVQELVKEARTLTEARELAKELFGRKPGETAYEELIGKFETFELVIKPTGRNNQSIIGTKEGVEKWFSTAQEKELKNLQAKLAKK